MTRPLDRLRPLTTAASILVALGGLSLPARECLAQAFAGTVGPRIIVFDLGGTIHLESNIRHDSGNIPPDGMRPPPASAAWLWLLLGGVATRARRRCSSRPSTV